MVIFLQMAGLTFNLHFNSCSDPLFCSALIVVQCCFQDLSPINKEHKTEVTTDVNELCSFGRKRFKSSSTVMNVFALNL